LHKLALAEPAEHKDGCHRRSFPDNRVILTAFVGRSLEDDEQGDHEERRGVSKSEVFDIVPLSQS
jgi:hypothetical protein